MHVFLTLLQEDAVNRKKDAAKLGMMASDSPKLRAAKRWRKAAMCVLNPRVAKQRSGLTKAEVADKLAGKKKKKKPASKDDSASAATHSVAVEIKQDARAVA